MANKRARKLSVLIILFFITCLFVYFPRQPSATVQRLSLQSQLAEIEGYHVADNIRIQEDIYNFLDLDDYIFADYLGKGSKINLFIGFYYTADKISAAHSPLACFPGQGWAINKPVYREISIDGHNIKYAEIIATREDKKELVLYWYQAEKKTTPHVYLNKINTIINKVTIGDEQHAFVRVTVSIADSSYKKARKEATHYIQSFYPKFLKFFEAESLPSS